MLLATIETYICTPHTVFTQSKGCTFPPTPFYFSFVLKRNGLVSLLDPSGGSRVLKRGRRGNGILSLMIFGLNFASKHLKFSRKKRGGGAAHTSAPPLVGFKFLDPPPVLKGDSSGGLLVSPGPWRGSHCSVTQFPDPGWVQPPVTGIMSRRGLETRRG